MRPFRIMYLWEFIQNLPLVSGLMLAIHWWQDAFFAASIGAMVSGGLLGAGLIRLTERNIVQEDQAGLVGNREPLTVTAANAGLMILFMLLLTVYLTAEWSSPILDLPVGGLIGFTLSAGQSRAAGRPIGGRHSLAFVVAFPIALLILRLLSASLPIVISSLLITAIVTLVITYIDYGHLTPIEGGTN